MLKKISCLFISVLLTVSTGVFAQQKVGDNKAKPEMTDTEKVASWKGEKVTVLGTRPLSCPPQSDAKLTFRSILSYENKEMEFLPYDKYAGQTGVIVEAKTDLTYPKEVVVVVQLDKTSEKIVSHTLGRRGLGLHSELENAKGLVGKSLWATRRQSLTLNSELCRDSGKRNQIQLRNLQKVTITRVEFGHHSQPIYLLLKTEDGQEGWLTGYDDDGYSRGGFYLDEKFYLKDPRKLYPTWKENIWKLIENQEVVIGMTWEMANMACRGIREVGIVLTGETYETSTIYQCNYKKFLVEKGKVTKYID